MPDSRKHFPNATAIEELRVQFDQLSKQAAELISTDPAKAKQISRRVLDTAGLLNSLHETSMAHFLYGTASVVLGLAKEAAPHLKAAIAGFESLGDLSMLAKARGNLTVVYAIQEQVSQALGIYKQLLDDFRSLKNMRAVAKTHFNIANILQKRSDYSGALQHLEQALKIYRQHHDPETEIEALNLMGYIHSQLLDPEKGLQCHIKALRVAESQDNKYLTANSLNHTANAYMVLKQPQQAMESWNKALKLARQLKIPHLIALPLSNMADVLSENGEHTKAEQYALKALALDEKTEIINYIAQDHYILGSIYSRMGRYEEAIVHFRASIDMAEQGQLREVYLSAALRLVMTYAKKKDFVEGERVLQPLLEALDEDPLSKIHLSILDAAATLYTAKGDFERSNQYLTRYSELTDKYIDQTCAQRAQNLMAIYETKRREREKRWLKKQNRVLERRVQEEIDKHREKDRRIAEQENMAMLGRITAGIAHELNNPLAAIKQIVEITLQAMEPNSDDTPYLSEKQADIYRMLNRINRLVEVVKVIAHSPDRFTIHPFNLNEVVAEFLELFADRIIDRDVSLITELADKPLLARGDAIRFLQVVSILVQNANDAVKLTSQVRIGKVRVKTYMDGNMVYLEVSDNGQGMDEQQLKLATQPFFSTKDVDKGLGMGLSIASSIVSNMGGKLTLRSSVNIGTVATLRVPSIKASIQEPR